MARRYVCPFCPGPVKMKPHPLLLLPAVSLVVPFVRFPASLSMVKNAALRDADKQASCRAYLLLAATRGSISG